jgi:exosortase/archaeosortase family protein
MRETPFPFPGRPEPIAALVLLAAVFAGFLPVIVACYQRWALPGGGLENRVIALVAIIYLVTRQKRLLDAPLAGLRGQWAGFAVLLAALALVQVGSLTVQAAALAVALVGLVLFRWGRWGVVCLGKPLAIAAMILVVNGLTNAALPKHTPFVLWLQYLVAGVATYLLWMGGVAVQLNQTVIRIGSSAGVDVNAVCSGIYSLFEVGVLAAVAILALSKQGWKANLRYFAACLGITFALNVLRVLLLVASTIFWGKETFDALHLGWGAVLYGNAISVIIVLFTSWFFQWNPFDPSSATESG